MPRDLFSDEDIAYQMQLIEQAINDRPLLRIPGGSKMCFVVDKRTRTVIPAAYKFAAIKIMNGQGHLASDQDIATWLQEQCEAVFATGKWKLYGSNKS